MNLGARERAEPIGCSQLWNRTIRKLLQRPFKAASSFSDFQKKDDTHDNIYHGTCIAVPPKPKNAIPIVLTRRGRSHMGNFQQMVGEADYQPTLDPEFMELLLCILKGAIQDLSMPGNTRQYAFYWLFQEHSHRIMSLEWICESLGMDADRLRKRIRNDSQPSPQMRVLLGMTCSQELVHP